jgi:hypothetical protein
MVPEVNKNAYDVGAQIHRQRCYEAKRERLRHYRRGRNSKKLFHRGGNIHGAFHIGLFLVTEKLKKPHEPSKTNNKKQGKDNEFEIHA